MKHKKVIALLLTSALLATSAVTNSYAASTPPDMPASSQGGTPPSMPGSPGQQAGSASSVTYTGAKEITSAATETGQTYASTTTDESALIVNTSEKVSLSNITLTKSGDSNGGDSCNFYGLNAGLLVMGGSETTINGGTITTNASGANGVFSYGGNGGTNGASGDGTTVNISDVTIKTTGSGSGGIMTTGGGTTNATNLTVETSGGSSAPIRTDRGGGTVNVDGGTYTSNGLGSPAIYSTADITVKNATLVSNLSEGVCIEGKNSITLTDCSLTANNTKTNGNAQFYDTIMIYQSMSGDADSGTSTFNMTGGTLTSKNGHVFHVTNTNAVITLDNVTIKNQDSGNVLLSVANDGWSGASNVATVNASNQTLSGDIIVSNAASSASSSTSRLTLNLSDGSSYTGAIGDGSDNSQVGTAAVSIDAGSSWTLTGDSYVSSISGADRVNYNGHTLYVNGTAYTASNPTEDVAATDKGTESDTGSSSDSTNVPAQPGTNPDGQNGEPPAMPGTDGSSQETAPGTESGNGTQATDGTGSGTQVTDSTENGNETSGDQTTTTAEKKKAVLKNTSKTLSSSTLKKKKVTFSILKSSNAGKVTYKVTKGAKKYISVSKKGIMTVKKGAKTGTYKVNITVAANSTYAKTTGTVTVNVK